MKTVKTQKGTVLPLISLKGKDYMQVAHRLQWFVEENTRYAITTNFLTLTSDETVAKVTVNLFDDKGQLLKTAEGTKRETKKDFFDHSEKAETGALGRALVQLGYGTQYAISDLDEGSRIVDSPVTDTREASSVVSTQESTVSITTEVKPKASFRKTKAAPQKETTPTNGTSKSDEDFFS